MDEATLIGRRGLRLRVRIPRSRPERMRGLLDRAHLDVDEGMLLPRTASIHTFGMRFPITVAHLDRGLRVLRVRTVSPRRIVCPWLRVGHVLECPGGTDLRVGDRLRMLSSAAL